MTVYFSVIHSPRAPGIVEHLSRILSSYGFQRANLSVGEAQTYSAQLRIEDFHRFVKSLFRWFDEGFGIDLPPWSVVASDRPLSRDQHPEYLPEWTLIEFFDSILIDDEPFSRLFEIEPQFASQFGWHESLRLHIFRRSRDVPERPLPPKDQPVAVPFEMFSSRPDVGAQITIVEALGFSQLSDTAARAYRDVTVGSAQDFGGLNALVLLSAERNRLRAGSEPQGQFSLFNLAALGLRYSTEPDSLPSLLADGTVEVLELTAQPSDLREDQ